uniref:Uncharacterized protein n=1 Tax=Timema monikensis TaxID=170555 RepID=A0A7R9EGK1_9NEOP|nr:unnamed protein product [Timema monikensis]
MDECDRLVNPIDVRMRIPQSHIYFTETSALKTYNNSAVLSRHMSSMRTRHPDSLPEYQTVDPYNLLEDDLKDVYDDIRDELRRNTALPELQSIATYYFDGQGKALRPMVAILMARAINYHLYKESRHDMPMREGCVFDQRVKRIVCVLKYRHH